MTLIRIAALLIVLVCAICTAILASLDPALGRMGVVAWACAGPSLGVIFSRVNRLGGKPQGGMLSWACSAAVLVLRLVATAGAMI